MTDVTDVSPHQGGPGARRFGASRPRALAGGLALLALPALLLAASAGIAAGPQTTTVANVRTTDYGVAVVALRRAGSPATAEVRIATAHRAGAAWRETGEHRLRETYFWSTLAGPHAICRLELRTHGGRPAFRPYVLVQLLQSPALGCGPVRRVALPTR